jgi:hypothetical protein
MTTEQLVQRLTDSGIVVMLPGVLPANRTLEIADALLASPIEAVEIVLTEPEALETVAAFVQRARGEMLVGVGRVESAEMLTAARQAGADFASSAAEFRLPLIAQAKRDGFLYIPTVHAPGQTLIALRGGAHLQKIRDDIDTEGLEGLQERTGGRVKYVINQMATEFIDAAVESGASVICVNDVFTGPQQPMGDIITRARQARRLWLTHASAQR